MGAHRARLISPPMIQRITITLFGLIVAVGACSSNAASSGAGGGSSSDRGPSNGAGMSLCPGFCQHNISPQCPQSTFDTCIGGCEDLFSRCPSEAQTYFDCARDIPI